MQAAHLTSVFSQPPSPPEISSYKTAVLCFQGIKLTFSLKWYNKVLHVLKTDMSKHISLFASKARFVFGVDNCAASVLELSKYILNFAQAYFYFILEKRANNTGLIPAASVARWPQGRLLCQMKLFNFHITCNNCTSARRMLQFFFPLWKCLCHFLLW